MVDLAQTVADIKALKIQGATNVAKAALKALVDVPTNEIDEATNQLISTRPTEPLLQNCLNLVRAKGKPVISLLLARLDDVESEIIKNGLPLIQENCTILTHCHSSTVANLLKTAKKKGMDFKVYLTETRPMMQGRMTAEELVKAGINSTMVADSEAAFLISKENKKEVDLVFLGADALFKDGSAFNKVGSYGISLAAQKAKIPVYVLTTLLKFSHKPVVIEERNEKEIWEDKPKNLKILNPAFDKIPGELVESYVTEFGLIKPVKIKTVVKKNYPWIGERVGENYHITFKTEKIDSGNPLDSRNQQLKVGSPYKSYLHLQEKVEKKNHIFADFLLTADSGTDFLETAGGVAAESSIGTWTQITTQLKDIWDKLHARVLAADEKTGLLKIAYPLDLFEKGNLPQLLSSVCGNIFGLKEIKNLKLLDLEFPELYVVEFLGPAFGITGIRKTAGVYNRPLVGSIIKPKLGLNYQKHAEVVKAVFEGGLDFVKDDENLTSQKFNPFEKRVSAIMKDLIHSGKLNKIYAFNVTAETETMIERAKFIKEKRGNCLMVDLLTAGFAGVQSLRRQNLNLIMHGHRAMHAALTRDPREGVSMLVLAKLARLAGIDSLHTGTVVGKMEGSAKEVKEINKFLLGPWYGLKPVLPVASGGLYPTLIPELIKILGKNLLLNFGGGIHGHPWGSRAGAVAVRAAVESVMKKVPLSTYAENQVELAMALKHWKKKI